MAESAERAYNSRAGGQWGSGLSDLATESQIDTVGFHLVPMYRVIGPTAAMALLCGWWLMGAFWETLFQVAVAPVQWAMAKGHTIRKTVSCQMTAEAAQLEIEDSEAQRGGGWTIGSQGADQQLGQAGELVQ
jgi:hypothetical protein